MQPAKSCIFYIFLETVKRLFCPIAAPKSSKTHILSHSEGGQVIRTRWWRRAFHRETRQPKERQHSGLYSFMQPDKTADWQKPQNEALPEWLEAGTFISATGNCANYENSYDSPGKKRYVTGYNLSLLLSLPVNQDRLFRRPTCSQEGKGL